MDIEHISFAVAIGVAFGSIISSILITVINNHHQMKLKKMELYEVKRNNIIFKNIESLGKYAASISNICSDYSTPNLKSYSNSFGIALTLVKDSKLIKMMLEFDKLITSHSYNLMNAQYQQMLPYIRTEIERYYQQY